MLPHMTATLTRIVANSASACCDIKPYCSASDSPLLLLNHILYPFLDGCLSKLEQHALASDNYIVSCQKQDKWAGGGEDELSFLRPDNTPTVGAGTQI